MNVGLCRMVLRLPENQSLKGKRQAAQSVISRIRSRFNVSVAEVEDNDLWQTLVLGVSCVSNSSRHSNQVLSEVVDFVQGVRGDLELLDYQLELVSAL